MSKKQKPEQRPAPARKPAPIRETAAATAGVLPEILRNSTWHGIIVAVLALILYANTLGHGFVLDDGIVITDNMFTQKGVSGLSGIFSKDTFFGFFKVEGKDALVSGGRYRPLTLAFFAVLHEVFGDKPFGYHLFTIMLFALTCFVLYRTLLLLLKEKGPDYAAPVAFMATLLFTVHPVHTEVVANIKGCDEITTLLFSLLALYGVLKAWDTNKIGWTFLAAWSFFLAALAKENAVTFLGVAPLALYVFRSKDGRAIGADAMRAWIPLLPAFLLFFVIRGFILHWKFGAAPMELMNNPFLKNVNGEWQHFTFAEKAASNFYTLLKYIQLLIAPLNLTHDYYPRVVPVMSLSNPLALLSLVLHIGLAIWATLLALRRDPIGFGIWFYLMTLSIVSNFVFPIGTSMGERFIFMPSVGFCLVAAVLLYRLKNYSLALGILGVVAALFAFKTITRNPAWESNERLFLTDVAVSGNSAKIRNACGGALYDKAAKTEDIKVKETLWREAITHLDKAVEIYPNYKDAYMTRAASHYYLKNYEKAIADYRIALRFAEGDTKPRTYLAVALRDGGRQAGEVKNDLATATKYLSESWEINPTDPLTARLLGVANGVQNKHAEAISWFQKAVELAPEEPSYLRDLSTAYMMSGNTAQGNALLVKIAELESKKAKEAAQMPAK